MSFIIYCNGSLSLSRTQTCKIPYVKPIVHKLDKKRKLLNRHQPPLPLYKPSMKSVPQLLPTPINPLVPIKMISRENALRDRDSHLTIDKPPNFYDQLVDFTRRLPPGCWSVYDTERVDIPPRIARASQFS